MNYTAKIIISITFFVTLTACSGNESDDKNPDMTTQDTIKSDPILSDSVPKNTVTALANPDAKFMTSKTISYTAYNTSTKDVTLYLYDSNNITISRTNVPSESYSNITFQIAIAESTILQIWRQRENVIKNHINLKGLSSVLFEEFD
ncbi:MAG: hypothetical protein COA99_11685 [Moraxellaceae bacterium]|nr:MAG: hypothetical protein COA99_11685 [Moraxellaceae bacterium]